MTDFGNGLLVAFGIGLLIFVHELGHFLAARWIGVRVEVFSLGFGPRLFGLRRGATDYRVSLIPLGGYVAVAGQDPTDWRHAPEHTLHQKTVGQRTLFYAGGVAMNLLFALVAFPLAFRFGVPFQVPEVGSVESGSAAWEADLQRGDRILAVNGKPTYSFENTLVEIALAGAGPVSLRVHRGDREFAVDVQPQFRAAEGIYMIGIGPAYEDQPPELQVRPHGPAERAGVRDGDLMLAIDGLPTTGPDRARAGERLMVERTALAPPPKVTLLVRRGGTEQSFTVEPDTVPGSTTPRIGVVPFANMVAGIRPGLRPLDALRLERGDVVLSIDGAPFRGPDLGVVADGAAPQLEIVVRRAEAVRRLAAPITAAERKEFAAHVALAADRAGLTLQPMADSPALRAGLLPGDHPITADDKPVHQLSDLQAVIRAAGERPLHLLVERAADRAGDPVQRVALTITPQLRGDHDYGFDHQLVEKRALVRADGFVDAVRRGCVCSIDLLKQVYVTFKRLLSGDVAAKNIGGIISMSRQTYRQAQVGWTRFLYFLALLSINLAFINVLPIPVLDGGHLLFLGIERIKGSPVSTRVLTYSQVVGLVLVLALVVFVTYNDILRLL
jgi:regulator of sigma E protease